FIFQQHVAPPVKTKMKILLFFKLYDPVKEELRYVGRLFVKGTGMPVEILPKLNEMAGFSADEEIQLFEEIAFKPNVRCEPIDNHVTFCSSQLEDGDIICFQKSPQSGSNEYCRCPDVISFLKSIRNGLVGELGCVHDKVEVFCDNQSSIHLTKNQMFHERTKHIDIKLHFIRDVVSRGIVTVEKIHTDENPADMLTKPTPAKGEAASGSSSFVKFDAMFANVQNLLEGKTSEAQPSDSFQSPLLSIEEISNANKTFKRCLDKNLTNVIKSGWTQEFMNSLSIIITSNSVPSNLVEELSWFLYNFDQSCERYMAAKQDIVEAEGKENSVGNLKTNLKQLSHQFMPIMNEAESSSLEDLTRQAATSRQTVINAEPDMKLNRLRKKQAEKTVVDMERLWESLKANSSPFLM
ncbi:hypothetical protein UlMin_025275, partial [Ulmus minor]